MGYDGILKKLIKKREDINDILCLKEQVTYANIAFACQSFFMTLKVFY